MTERPESGPSPVDEQQRIAQRINEAYASSGPVLPDDPAVSGDGASTEGGSDNRFAAVLAATQARLAAAREAGRPVPSMPPPEQPAARPAAPTGARPAQPRPAAQSRPGRGRRVHLRVTHVDPWSVMKTAFLLSVAIGIVTVVAVGVVWWVIEAAGIFESIDRTVADVVGESGTDFRVEDYLGMSRVMGFTLLVAAVDVVLLTVIATLGAFLYNLAAVLLGGVEVTLAEDDR